MHTPHITMDLPEAIVEGLALLRAHMIDYGISHVGAQTRSRLRDKVSAPSVEEGWWATDRRHGVATPLDQHDAAMGLPPSVFHALLQDIHRGVLAGLFDCQQEVLHIDIAFDALSGQLTAQVGEAALASLQQDSGRNPKWTVHRDLWSIGREISADQTEDVMRAANALRALGIDRAHVRVAGAGDAYDIEIATAEPLPTGTDLELIRKHAQVLVTQLSDGISGLRFADGAAATVALDLREHEATLQSCYYLDEGPQQVLFRAQIGEFAPEDAGPHPSFVL